MVCGTFTMAKVSADDVDGVVQRYQLNDPPPLSVTKQQEADGTWTVVATFPPCPDTVTHSTGGDGQ
jgi:hypothetical protein